MADKTYPIGMYMSHGPDVELEVRYAHTQKEEEAFAEAGFTNDRRNLGPNDYPRLMYDKNGEYLRVVSKLEEDAAVKLGYGRKAVIKTEVAKPNAANGAASNSRIDALEENVQSLSEVVLDLKQSMAQILDAVSAKKK